METSSQGSPDGHGIEMAAARAGWRKTHQGMPQPGSQEEALMAFQQQLMQQIMPQVVHVHGKFYDFDAEGNEASIDYGSNLPVFHDGGFTGFMSSEWEGHLYMRNVDAFDMVAKHQAQARRVIARHTGVAA